MSDLVRCPCGRAVGHTVPCPPPGFLTAAPTPGRESVSPSPGPGENGPSWDDLGPGHDAGRCSICRARRQEAVSLAIASVCIGLLLFGLLLGWWT